MKGRISEIFSSIQGEGIYLGEKQIFVRFHGCNLSCQFCDTKLNEFCEYTPQELFEKIKSYPCEHHSVSFTGGEPLLQKEFLRQALKITKENRMTNYLETNGTLVEELKEVIDLVDIIAMDFKLSSSTGLENYFRAHRRFLEIASKKDVFIKMVICSDTSVEELMHALEIIKEVNPAAVIVLQPNSAEDMSDRKLKHFSSICVEHGLTVCIIPQIHKMVGAK